MALTLLSLGLDTESRAVRLARQGDCLQHHVHSILRGRFLPSSHSPTVAFVVVEHTCGDIHVHDLDCTAPCIVHFIDSIVWNRNTINWAPVWCDIGVSAHPTLGSHGLDSAIRIIVGISATLLACTLCITCSLYNITMKTTPLEVRSPIVLGFPK